jgi:hypothetical protein
VPFRSSNSSHWGYTCKAKAASSFLIYWFYNSALRQAFFLVQHIWYSQTVSFLRTVTNSYTIVHKRQWISTMYVYSRPNTSKYMHMPCMVLTFHPGANDEMRDIILFMSNLRCDTDNCNKIGKLQFTIAVTITHQLSQFACTDF